MQAFSPALAPIKGVNDHLMVSRLSMSPSQTVSPPTTSPQRPMLSIDDNPSFALGITQRLELAVLNNHSFGGASMSLPPASFAAVRPAAAARPAVDAAPPGGNHFSLEPHEFESLVEGGVVLGRGATAVVEQMRWTANSGAAVAVKHIAAVNSQQRDAICRELAVAVAQRACSSKDGGRTHVVHLHGAFSTPTGASIVMELMVGSFGGPHAMPVRILSTVAKMFLRGLRFMHEDLHVMHRDLKPTNLLYDADGTLKITDFGLSVRLDAAAATSDRHVGSMLYMSPERLRGEQYGYAGDVFGFGVTIAQMLLGKHPLTASLGNAIASRAEERFWGLCGAMRINDGIDASAAATDASFRAALSPHCSPALLDFILRCVHADPARRPTCAELLEHQWLLACDDAVDDDSDDDGFAGWSCDESDTRPDPARASKGEVLRWLKTTDARK
jgi:serine/threonine protein kinase